MPSAQFALPDGWRMHLNVTSAEAWLGVTGPQGQLAAFDCKFDSVRYEALNQLLVDLIGAAATPADGEVKHD
jgi:hypothetical protein